MVGVTQPFANLAPGLVSSGLGTDAATSVNTGGGVAQRATVGAELMAGLGELIASHVVLRDGVGTVCVGG